MSVSMTHRSIFTKSAIVTLVAASLTLRSVAVADEADQNFKEAYFQQTHERDYSAAAAAYEKVLANPAASESLRAEAKTRAAQCREEQAAANLVQLMPADAVLYCEVNRPGKHIGGLLDMLGLLAPFEPRSFAQRPNRDAPSRRSGRARRFIGQSRVAARARAVSRRRRGDHRRRA